MKPHAFEAWDVHDPYCRYCGGHPHPDYRPLAILRDGVIGALLLFVAILGAVTWLS